jgi:glycerol-3-phosphate dehydrogenase (NAD(P)+)
MSSRELTILGGGSWGTALAVVLAPRFDRIRLWMFEAELAQRIAATRINDVYLPEIHIPESVEVVSDLGAVLNGAAIVLCVVPSKFARSLYRRTLPYLDPQTTFVSATKGIEHGSLLRMSELMADVIRPQFEPKIAVLSGPTFAKEVARGEPAAVVIAADDAATAAFVQEAFSGPTFRLYTNADPVGVEVGGALKNVIAIAAGVVQGLGLGNNTQAALITRGLAEITRLAVAMGAQPTTTAGLAGLGDLVLTCNGELSRNRRVGIELTRGRTLADIISSTPTVAEGVETCASAVALGARYNVDLPIIQQMDAVLHQGKDSRAAIRDLMDRSLKGE